MLLPESFSRYVLKKYSRVVIALDEMMKQRPKIQAQGTGWAEWCALPSFVVQMALSTTKESVKDTPLLKSAYVWQMTKQVFRFDSTLRRELEDQPFDGTIPAEVLTRLPVPCVYIEGKTKCLDAEMDGFFAMLDSSYTEEKILSLLYIGENGRCQDVDILLMDTLEESVKRSAEIIAKAQGWEIRWDDPKAQEGYQEVFEMLSKALNLLLYICADEPDYDKPPRRAKAKRESATFTDERPPRAAAVSVAGERIGAAIRKAQGKDAGEKSKMTRGAGSHTPKAPHIRRAHWHHYWAGARSAEERRLVLKWMPPIFVGKDADDLVTIRPVKKG